MSDLDSWEKINQISKKNNIDVKVIIYLINNNYEKKHKKNTRDLVYITDPGFWELNFSHYNSEKNISNIIENKINKNAEKTIYI